MDQKLDGCAVPQRLTAVPLSSPSPLPSRARPASHFLERMRTTQEEIKHLPCVGGPAERHRCIGSRPPDASQRGDEGCNRASHH